MQDEQNAGRFEDRAVSNWSRKEKIRRVLWAITEQTIFRYSLHNMNRWRAFLLRLFGARIGKNTMIRRTVQITIPWNLSLGNWSSLGDHAIIYALGKITIGDRTSVSQYAHLCAGTHDYTRIDMPLLRPTITIGDDCWIATDAFVGPGVTIGSATVVGARSSVYKNIPSGKVAVGNPAKVIKERELN